MTIDPTASETAPTERAVRQYCDDLLFELRVRDVPGERIGAVLTEVRAHLLDSGEAPEEAFGAPGACAASLAGDRQPQPLRERVGLVVRTTTGFLGYWGLAEGVAAVVGRDEAVFGLLPTLALVLAGALVALLASWVVDLFLRSTGWREAAVVVAVLLAVSAVAAVTALAPDLTVAVVPAPWALGAGLLLVVASFVGAPGADPVVRPFDSPATAQAEGRRLDRRVRLLHAGHLALALAAVAAVVALTR